MYQEIQSFYHRKQAHFKQIKKSRLLRTLRSNQKQQIITHYQTFTNADIHQHIQRVLERNQSLGRGQAGYFWKRMMELKKDYESIENEELFRGMRAVTGLDVDWRMYNRMEKGWRRWKIQTVEKTVVRKRRSKVPSLRPSYRTFYSYEKVNFFRLSRKGEIVLEGRSPVFYPPTYGASYTQRLFCAFGHLIGSLQRVTAARNAREKRGELD